MINAANKLAMSTTREGERAREIDGDRESTQQRDYYTLGKLKRFKILTYFRRSLTSLWSKENHFSESLEYFASSIDSSSFLSVVAAEYIPRIES